MRLEKYIARAWALRIREPLIEATISRMERMTGSEMQLGDDSGLLDVWEEVCVQVQGEESMFWSAYVDTIDSILMGRIKMLDRDEQLALWVMTDSGWDYVYDHHADESGSEADIPLDLTEIVDMIRDEIMIKAADYESPTIDAYLHA